MLDWTGSHLSPVRARSILIAASGYLFDANFGIFPQNSHFLRHKSVKAKLKKPLEKWSIEESAVWYYFFMDIVVDGHDHDALVAIGIRKKKKRKEKNPVY